MGAIIPSSFPDKLSEDELKNIIGDKFDSFTYDLIKDKEGFVDKSKLLEMAMEWPEKTREVEDIRASCLFQ